MADLPDEMRQAVLERDYYTCQVCGLFGEHALHVHHLVYRSSGGGHEMHNLITLCWKCHRMVHEERLRVGRHVAQTGEWQIFWEMVDDDV